MSAAFERRTASKPSLFIDVTSKRNPTKSQRDTGPPSLCSTPAGRAGGGSPSRPTQWFPSPYAATSPGLNDTIFMRTRGTGPVWTTNGQSDSRPVTSGSFSPVRSRPGSMSNPNPTPPLNGTMSLHGMAKATGNASPAPRVRHIPTHAQVAKEKFITHPLQRGGISSFG